MKKNEIKIPDGYDLFTDEDIRELALGMTKDGLIQSIPLQLSKL